MNCHRNWRSIGYLKQGSETQKRAFRSLQKSKVLLELSQFDPIVVGTVPLGINLPYSDIDIVCHFSGNADLRVLLNKMFSHLDSFKSWTKEYDDGLATVCVFRKLGFEYEIFLQDKPSDQQMAFRHMVQECRLLNLLGENFKVRIIELKKNGIKTEPAFATVLGLKGNPYRKLLDFENKSDLEILNKYERCICL
jgi:hypothetical protein